MNEIELNPNLNTIDQKTEEQFTTLHKRLQENGDGTGVVTVDSDVVLQFYINDSNKVLNATIGQLPIVLNGIANRIDEIHHPKLKALYYPLVSFAHERYQQSLTITKIRHEEASFTVSNQDCIFVQPNQINYVNETLAEIYNPQKDANAKVEPDEIFEFNFQGIDTYVCNRTRDRIFRCWYVNRERHHRLTYSNRKIAKEMNAELGVDAGYAEKIISYVNRWFASPTDTSWLSGDYIMRAQMYFSYRGYSHLKLNYLYQPPSQQQIIVLGKQLHVSTKEHPEE
jgi:hypothetical protein